MMDGGIDDMLYFSQIHSILIALKSRGPRADNYFKPSSSTQYMFNKQFLSKRLLT